MARRRPAPSRPTQPSPNERPRAALLWLGGLLPALALLPPARAFAMPYEDLRWPALTAGLIVALALLLAGTRAEPGPIRRLHRFDPLALGAALIGGGLLLSALASPAPLLGLRTGLREIFFVGFALCLALRPARGIELAWVVAALLAATAFEGLLALAQGLLPSPGMPGGRALMHGTFEQSEVLSSFLGAGAAAAGVVALTGGAGRGWRLAGGLVLAAAATAIFIAGGRGGALAGAAALAAGLLVRRSSGRPSPTTQARWMMAAAAMGVALLAGLLWLALPGTSARQGTLPARLAQMFDPESLSIRHRIGLTRITGEMILDAPLTGAGPGRFAAAFGDMQARLAEHEDEGAIRAFNELTSHLTPMEAHSDPLQWWAEYGAAPFLGLLLMALAALWAPMPRLRAGPPWLAALWAALLALALGMWVSYPLREPVRALLLWMLVGLLAGCGAREEKKPAADQ